VFFKSFYIDYFKINSDNCNIKEKENRNSYTLILYNITQLHSNKAIFDEFISKYINSMNCSIEFQAMFNDSDDEEDLDFADNDVLDSINTIGLKFLRLKIDKPATKSIIFDTISFEEHLNTLELKEILLYFSKHDNLFVFDLDKEINNEFYSINKFYSNEQTFTNFEEIEKKINERNKLSFFYNASECRFIPDIFNFEEIYNKSLYDIFKFLLFVSSIIYISDYSFFKEKEFHFKIRDKKFSINCYQEFVELLNKNNDIADNYYLIYNWIYNDAIYNNTSDKFEIAVHTIDKCNTSNEIYIENRIFEVIKSSFNLYLKENVDKYLIFKQKIIENITSSINECYNILNDVKKAHMQFLLSIFTVLFTLIIGETISQSQSKILTDEVSIILCILILIIFGLSYYKKQNAIKEINKIFKISSDLKVEIKKDLKIEDDIFDVYDEKDVLEELIHHQNIFYCIVMVIIISILVLNKLM